MKKRIISFIMMFAMSLAILSPIQVKTVQAEEVAVSNWAIPDLLFGDTYGIYPLKWYEDGLTGNISKSQFRVLLYGLRRKLVETNAAKEVRSAKPLIDDSITVKEAIEAFYTMMANFDYSLDLGLQAGYDAVTYMTQIGVYTGLNGEQSLDELCSIEQAMVMATRIVTLYYEVLGASSKGFLWQIKSGTNTVYLLGSIHMASADFYPLSNKIWSAYYNSDALVVEANLFDESDIMSLQEMMFYLDGTNLKDHISADTYKKLVQVGELMGYPEEIITLIKPWALYLILSNYSVLSTSVGEDVSSNLGIDSNFLTHAVIYQKPIYAAEGLKKQAEIMESFSDALLEYLLNNYCDQINNAAYGEDTSQSDELNKGLEVMFSSWKEGNIEAFAQLSGESGLDDFSDDINEDVKALADEYKTKFLVQRDDAMAEYIHKLLNTEGSNTYFVILGSLHYISDYSVIDRLVEDGYVLTQIK